MIAIRLKYLNNDSILELITLIGKKLVKLIDYHQNKRIK
jgi:hypothetical protein